MYVVAFLGAATPAIVFSFIIGAVAAVGISFIYRRRGKSRLVPMLVTGILVTLIVFAATALINAYTTVEYGTVGLVVRFGGLTGQVFEPGLHWKTPFIDKVVSMPTIVQSYETSDHPEESGANFPDVPVTAQTVDGQQITVKYTLLFRIPADKAVPIVQNVGYLDAIVENNVKAYSRNLSRLWAQNYRANDLYSGEGIFNYEKSVHDALEQAFKPHGIMLENFLVRKVDFSQDYVNAIEQKQIAQEAIETAKYESEAAEYEKERQIRLAEAEAKRTTLLAEAEAEKARLLADAEAYGIESRGKALARYPTLVQWEFVRNLENVQWGILPGEGITPLVPVPEFK
jgi:regulator of protease activity HflC (stomatin/prohibitin superfamily)